RGHFFPASPRPAECVRPFGKSRECEDALQGACARVTRAPIPRVRARLIHSTWRGKLCQVAPECRPDRALFARILQSGLLVAFLFIVALSAADVWIEVMIH